MKDSKSPDSHDEIPDKNFNKELLETKKNKDLELISSTNNELDQKDDDSSYLLKEQLANLAFMVKACGELDEVKRSEV